MLYHSLFANYQKTVRISSFPPLSTTKVSYFSEYETFSHGVLMTIHQTLIRKSQCKTGGEEKIKWRMAYQLTVIGVSVGGQTFNFFGELGYGSLGIVRLGFGFMF